MKNKRLVIVKIQRSLFSSNGEKKVLIYEVDPITLDRLSFPEEQTLDEELEDMFFNWGDEEYNKVYWLVQVEKHGHAKFIDAVLTDEWE